MLRPLGFLLLLIAAACTSEDSAPNVSLQQLLPEGRVNAERMQIRPPLPIAAIGFVMQRSMKEHKAWTTAYIQEHDAPGALPYHENFGVSEEEYDRYIASMEAGESALRADAKVSFEVTHFGEKSKLKSGEALATVNNLEFDWAADTVRTPWGDLVGSEVIQLDGERAALAPFVGRRWELSLGDIETALSMESGNAKMLKVYLGTRHDNQEVLLYVRAASVQQGITYVNDEVILQWPMR
jgi:hypothetical protein